MRLIAVGMAELKVSDDPESALVAYGLGSCIAVAAWDPAGRVGGMLHFMLPLSARCPERARENPVMFADLAIPMLFEAMAERCGKRRGLVVKVAGGARCWDDKGTFDIGARNITVLRKMLWKHGVTLSGADLGGTRSRTVRLRIADGRFTVRTDGVEEEL